MTSRQTRDGLLLGGARLGMSWLRTRLDPRLRLKRVGPWWVRI